VDSLPNEELRVNFIESDNFQGAYDATKHLLDLGHRKILKIAGDQIAKGSFDRINGYKKALDAYDVPFEESLVHYAHYSRENAYQFVIDTFSIDSDITAIFASSDLMAMGAIDALNSLGKRIPEDISVVGFDDIDSAQYFSPPLTTVHQQRLKMGEAASKILLELIHKNEGIVHHIHIPTQLVIRGSSGELK